MKAVILKRTGSPKVLKISDVEIPKPSKKEVLIKIKYSGVNYADLLTRQGLYSWAPNRPNIMGLEAVGEIVTLGDNVNKFSIGERVFVGVQQGGYAEFICVNEKFVLHVPEFYNWKEAAAFGVHWFTAWIGLQEVARVREGETVLIHSGAGGVGTAAIIIAKTLKLEVFATCSPEKKDTVEKLGAKYLPYKTFDEELKNINKLPDCVIETIGGDVFTRSFDILSPMGRIVVIGASGIQINKFNPVSWYRAWKALPKASMSDVLRSSKGFMGFHIGYLLEHSDRILPIWNNMIDIIEKYKLRPIISDEQIFPLSHVDEAHQFVHDRKNRGKVLLDPSK